MDIARVLKWITGAPWPYTGRMTTREEAIEAAVRLDEWTRDCGGSVTPMGEEAIRMTWPKD